MVISHGDDDEQAAEEKLMDRGSDLNEVLPKSNAFVANAVTLTTELEDKELDGSCTLDATVPRAASDDDRGTDTAAEPEESAVDKTEHDERNDVLTAVTAG